MNDFLKELEELCNKHGVVVGGCGCCGSPWVLSGGRKVYKYVTDDEVTYDAKYVCDLGCKTKVNPSDIKSIKSLDCDCGGKLFVSD